MIEGIRRIKYVKLLELLRQESDEDRPLSTPYILKTLKERGIEIDRRVLYEDIKTLNEQGYEILCKRSRSNEYYIVDRQFDIPELRILMDAVESASFITEKKTVELQTKIASLGGSYWKELLVRNDVIFDTNKHSNNLVLYSVNEIIEAINRNQKITFTYFDLDYKGNRAYRKECATYEVNPIATIFSNDNYYLVCFSDKYQNYSNYRIDRMDKVKRLETERTNSPLITEFDIASYRKQCFGMYVGEAETVKLQFDKSLIDVVFDKFGEKTKIEKLNDDTYETKVKVIASEQFFGMLLGLGTKVKLIAPAQTVKRFKGYVEAIITSYE